MVDDVPFVQSPGELIYVSGKMLCGGMVIDTVQATLQNGPDALDPVGVGGTTHVLARAVVDGSMVVVKPVQVAVGPVLIGVELRPDFHRAVNLVLDGGESGIRYHGRVGSSTYAAFAHPQDGNLGDRTAPRLQLLVLMFVGLQAAHKAFVNLNDALQPVDGIRCATSLTQPSQDKPRCLLGDADLFGELQTGNPLAGGHQQVHGIHPFVQRDFGPLEDRPGTDGEVEIAVVAVVETDALPSGDSVAVAVWTGGAIRPDTAFQIRARRLFIGKEFE